MSYNNAFHWFVDSH